MCNTACVDFARGHLKEEDIQGKSVLEVGSLDVNGTLRPFVEGFGPERYVGVDIEAGPGVDEICDARDVLKRFGPESFDVLLTTELLEHVRDWRAAIRAFKGVLRPGGVLLLTTRSKGHPYHGYPFDFWRYESEDMKAIFKDFDVDVIAEDTMEPGVFVKATKPSAYAECSLDGIALYAIITQKRMLQVSAGQAFWFRFRFSTRRAYHRSVFWLWDTACTLTPAPVRRMVKRCLAPFRADNGKS